MRIKGFIRRGSDSTEIALQNEGKFFQLIKSPLTDILEVFYNFILSDREQQVLGGKTYFVRVSSINGNTTRSVSFNTGIGVITVSRYSLTYSGELNTSDKVVFNIEIPSLGSDGEDSTPYSGEDYDDGNPT